MANDNARPANAAPDWTIGQNSACYTAADHAMWDKLFARQAAMLPSRDTAPAGDCAFDRIMHAETQVYVREKTRT